MSKKPPTLEMADDLEEAWGLTIHADELRRLYAENQTLRQEKTDAYNEGVSAGIYKARNALTDLYRL